MNTRSTLLEPEPIPSCQSPRQAAITQLSANLYRAQTDIEIATARKALDAARAGREICDTCGELALEQCLRFYRRATRNTDLQSCAACRNATSTCECEDCRPMVDCTQCAGDGFDYTVHGCRQEKVQCPACDGTGVQAAARCECDGVGAVLGEFGLRMCTCAGTVRP